MSRSSVSIIIPTYNRSGFLKESVESVLSQTFNDFELIIVDDGSTDDTADVVSSSCDPRIQYEYQVNRGVSSARNVGVSLATAPYIAFLDSDDIWLPGKLENQLSFFHERPDISICQTEELWVRNGRRVNPRQKHAKHSGWIFEACLPLCIVSPSAVMFRREAFDALGGFDESFPACEDYDLWLRAALRYEIHTLSEPMIIKRGGHDDQLSRQWGLDVWRIRALEKILGDSMLSEKRRDLVFAEIARRSRIVADGAKKRGNDELYREYEEKLGGRDSGIKDKA
jgi:glycosyltransferase involved in cell wall biosynthesis